MERRRRSDHNGGSAMTMMAWVVAMLMVMPLGVMSQQQQLHVGSTMMSKLQQNQQYQGMNNELPPPCDSKIYCYGELLKTVQLATPELFNDSKTFVDMFLKKTVNETLRAFGELMNRTGNNPTNMQLKNFLEIHFEESGDEFDKWEPSDWTDKPEFLNKVQDPELESWGKDLNKIWMDLGRKISTRVKDNPDKYSLIYVDNPVIVPGGRFREFYYWDSYWTIDGLLLSGMTETVKGMLENFLQMVKEYGMVPNGGRVYYTRRSQPPYLIPMVKLYLDHTDDKAFLQDNIDTLKKEYEFWENERSTKVNDHTVFQYKVNVGEPRPESYREDYNLAQQMKTEEQQKIYVELKSGAESGWDYSTRWFINKKNQTNKGTLKDLNVTSIVPVDLNSLMCMNARILSEFYSKLFNNDETVSFKNKADKLNETMSQLFWDNTDGVWYDYDLKSQSKRRYFYLSNIHPIWSGCYGYDPKVSQAKAIDSVINYLEKMKVTSYVGGVPTSLESSSHQQWDFPNAWAPLQHIAIMGLYNARNIHHAADGMAFSLAEKWIRTNWNGYQQSEPHSMFEKYNVSVVGLAGGGGEYNVQKGFGWSNGVAMRLLDIYGDRLTATTGASAPLTATSLLILLPVVFATLVSQFLF